MKKNNVRKLVISIMIVLVMVIPVVTSCTVPSPTPSPTPTPTPTQEPAPTPEKPETLPTYKLRYQGYHEPIELNDYLGRTFEKMEVMSGGRIEVTAYAMDQLVDHDDILTAIQLGTIDMALWGSALNPITETAPFECTPAFMWVNADEYEALYWKRGLREVFNEAYAPFNAYWITNWVDDPMNLVSIKPVKTYEDLKGLRISTMPEYVPAYSGAGAVVVELPIEEYYLAGETGVIDAINWASGIAYYKMGLSDLFHHLTNPPMSNPWQGCILIRKDLWESMPPDIQEIIYCAWRESSMDSWCRQYSAFTHYAQYFEVHTLSQEDVDKLEASSRETWPDYASRGPLAQQAYDIMTEYFDEVEAAGWFR